MLKFCKRQELHRLKRDGENGELPPVAICRYLSNLLESYCRQILVSGAPVNIIYHSYHLHFSRFPTYVNKQSNLTHRCRVIHGIKKADEVLDTLGN
jgi:hypothetical protein